MMQKCRPILKWGGGGGAQAISLSDNTDAIPLSIPTLFFNIGLLDVIIPSPRLLIIPRRMICPLTDSQQLAHNGRVKKANISAVSCLLFLSNSYKNVGLAKTINLL